MKNPDYKSLSSLNKFEAHRFVDSNKKERVIYPLDRRVLENFYEFFMRACDIVSRQGCRITICEQRMRHAFSLAADEIHKNMNFHNYAPDMSETKYLSRICFFWLKQKPVIMYEGAAKGFDVTSINERIVVSVLTDYVFAVVNTSLLNRNRYWFKEKDEQKRYYTYLHHMCMENVDSLQYFLTNYSTNIHLIELYVEGILDFAKRFIDYGDCGEQTICS